MDDTEPFEWGAQLAAGALLAGRYRLTGLVGRGGVADVFAAVDEVLGRPVAVKLFRSDDSGLDDPQRHQREMRLLAQLNHPGLVTIYDGGIAETGPLSQPFLVMELIDGDSLAQRLARDPLSHRETCLLAGRLADALAYIHGRQVVHRDVKPGNVLLGGGPPDSARLTDFGIARIAGDARLTSVGMTIGTAHYLSPEQALGSEVGPASDIYSLGLVLLECRTGQPAFPGPAIESAMARLHRGPEIPAVIDPTLGGLLARMTALRPADRPSATDIVVAARSLVDQSTGPHPVTALAETRQLATHSRPFAGRSLALGIGALALAVLAGLFPVHDQHGAAGRPAPTPPTTRPTASSISHSAVPTPTPSKVVAVSTSPTNQQAPPGKGPKPKKSHPGKHDG
ncbi:MAG: serine/threonine protein kinase [Actinomycetota bacterium]|nr:serine/threonine protein kinase [Actinomycetota bacterium]MDQ2956817.1 serine/threonine protein kinase [Actinomycetota bacterium]